MVRSSTLRSDTEPGIAANHERLTGNSVSSRARLETLFPVRRSWLAAMPGSVSDLSVDERTTQTHSAVCVALLTARHNVHGDSFDGRCGEVG